MNESFTLPFTVYCLHIYHITINILITFDTHKFECSNYDITLVNKAANQINGKEDDINGITTKYPIKLLKSGRQSGRN